MHPDFKKQPKVVEVRFTPINLVVRAGSALVPFLQKI